MKLVFVFLVLAGCSKQSNPNARAACENMVDLCRDAALRDANVKWSKDDIAVCVGEIERQAVDAKTVTCLVEAKTCESVIECAPVIYEQ